MPDLAWNKTYWDGGYDWQGRGEEWSEAWGSSEAQWFGSLYPRLHRFLPAEHVLEIAPGYGRWTRHLLRHIHGGYHGIDMANEVIGHCQRTFIQQPPHIQFDVNDGLSLAAAPDHHFDLVFSFDSLVHADLDVHEIYIPQILAKLKTTGVAFIHHSNWADANETQPNTHCRAENVSGQLYAELIRRAGGHVLIQECINWGTETLIDALTLFCRADRPHLSSTIEIANPHFMLEATLIKNVYHRYCQVN
ncbi:class I SAM-dependent methyltransferase [Thiospirillum jenense]|uniref:Class I SAM-dependent methyltransferase n=1 Tax=Thiospirillum jenense TaxID=1653858 RepID=A0A839HDE0_9GAMM|nr:class I SAM-dependent methyltransferase [Thiospirillum jenense]MBB1126955.1 class I SAM-dependent methyltransferase [Thiospirillum jenense]